MSLTRFVLMLALLAGPALSIAGPEDRAEAVEAFAADVAKKHDMKQQDVLDILAKARFRHDIIKIMKRPAEGKPWHEYRKIFMTSARAKGGAEFWRDNAALLEKAEKTYGVPPQIITAIIGVETRYGGYIGKHRVLDALSTLAFGYPKRSKFFTGQLEEFLLLAKEEDVDLEASVGSYAGAMGMPQFIPSSYRAYAVDFDGDGKRDLYNSKADIIGSVANYFKRHGWKAGADVTVKADSGELDTKRYVKAGMKPSLSMKELRKAGIKPQQAVSDDETVSFIALEQKDGHDHWLGLKNFYVITRYNHSNMYAMAVYQLSQEILALRNEEANELPGR